MAITKFTMIVQLHQLRSLLDLPAEIQSIMLG